MGARAACSSRRRLWVLAFLLSLASATGCPSVRPPEAPRGAHVSVMTFNVNYGMPGADEAVAAIREAGTDIVCLQETTEEWERLLRASLAAEYPHMAFRHSGGAGGVAVLSKRAFRETALVPSAVGWFPGWVLEAETAVGTVQILDLHLRPAASETGSFSPGAYLYKNRALHLEEIQAFHPRLDPRLPTIVCGDFNEGDGGAALSWLGERGFADTLPEFDRSADTWRWETSVGTVRKRLDHILHSAGLRSLSATVLPRGRSDHLPVVAVFERGGEPPGPAGPGR